MNNKTNPALAALRHHVTGAVERGEAEAITEQPANPLAGMTAERWSALTEAERSRLRSTAGLTPQLIGLEGWRVEAVTEYGETRRFIVSRSTGWIPCHIEVKRSDSHGGMSAEKTYKSVRKLYRVR